MKESELEKKCLEFCQKYPTIAVWKIKAMGQKHTMGGKRFFKKSSIPGFPDLLICSKGKFIGVELKSIDGRQSQEQKLCQEKIENSEGKYYLVRDLENFKQLLEQIK